MNILTEIAALTGAESVTVEWRDYHSEELRYAVKLFKRNPKLEFGWMLWEGKGPTPLAAAFAAVREMEADDAR